MPLKAPVAVARLLGPASISASTPAGAKRSDAACTAGDSGDGVRGYRSGLSNRQLLRRRPSRSIRPLSVGQRRLRRGGDASLRNNSATQLGRPSCWRSPIGSARPPFSDLLFGTVRANSDFASGACCSTATAAGLRRRGMRRTNIPLVGYQSSASTDASGYVAGGGIDYIVTQNFVIAPGRIRLLPVQRWRFQRSDQHRWRRHRLRVPQSPRKARKQWSARCQPQVRPLTVRRGLRSPLTHFRG